MALFHVSWSSLDGLIVTELHFGYVNKGFHVPLLSKIERCGLATSFKNTHATNSFTNGADQF